MPQVWWPFSRYLTLFRRIFPHPANKYDIETCVPQDQLGILNSLNILISQTPTNPLQHYSQRWKRSYWQRPWLLSFNPLKQLNMRRWQHVLPLPTFFDPGCLMEEENVNLSLYLLKILVENSQCFISKTFQNCQLLKHLLCNIGSKIWALFFSYSLDPRVYGRRIDPHGQYIIK